MTMLEVERRYVLQDDSDRAALSAALDQHGYKGAGLESQADTYYTSKYKDFISSEECLRIRTRANLDELTWKPPSSKEMLESTDFWKEEVDLRITGQRQTAERLLEALDFEVYVIVRKDRITYRGPSNSEVSIDVVAGVGTFVELEVKASDRKAAQRRLDAMAEQLGLANLPTSNVPYRDLVPRA